MNYHDYMAQFALPDETKSLLAGRMQQRARRLHAAGAEASYRAASEEEPRKKNTFRLHPMRWAAIFMSIALVATVTPLLAIFLPRGEEQIVSNEIKLDYMKDLMVETEGVTAYSIRRETVEEPAESLTFTGEDEGPAISLLSAHPVKEGVELLAGETKTYQYLYSTTDRYEAGNVEYDETGIQKVTFMKNREVTEDVYDENGQLIGSERRIGQEELDAQINRMYTTDRFTFVQFVAKVEESGYYKYIDAEGNEQGEYIQLRPEGLHFDENGVSDFDKGYYVSMPAGQIVLSPSVFGGEQEGIRVDLAARVGGCGYYSSAFSAAFVIDNETGYFYKIENLEILGFRNGLVIDKNACVYTVDVDADRNLVFTDVVPNKDIVVYDVYSDGNGWTYVYNNTLDSVDRERKTAYTTKKYYFDAEGDVYFPQGETNVLTQRVEEGELVPFENQGYIRDLHTFDWRWGTQYSAEHGYLRGYCGNLAIYSREGWSENWVTWGELVDDAYKEYIFVAGYMQAENAADTVHGLSLEFDQTVVNAQIVEKWAWRWLDDDYNVLLAITDGTLYYKEVDLTQYADRSVVLTAADFTQLSDRQLEPYDDYDMSVGNDFYKVEGVYRYKGLNETKYYRVVRTETGLGLEELTSKSYDDNIFIFQPINK